MKKHEFNKGTVTLIGVFIVLILYFSLFENKNEYLHDFKNIKNKVTENVVIDHYNNMNDEEKLTIDDVVINEKEFKKLPENPTSEEVVKGEVFNNIEDSLDEINELVELAKLKSENNENLYLDELDSNKIDAINKVVEADKEIIKSNIKKHGDYHFIELSKNSFVSNIEDDDRVFFEEGRKFIFQIPRGRMLSEVMSSIINDMGWELKWAYVDDLMIEAEILFNGTFYDFLKHIKQNYLKKDIELSVYKKSEIIEVSQNSFTNNKNIKKQLKELRKEESVF